MFWFLLLLLPVGVLISYRFSAMYAARKSAGEALVRAEALLAEAEQRRQGLAMAVEQAAAAYSSALVTERLRATPVEAFKQHTAGLRLQALRDAGIHNLQQMQGWTASRIAQVHGVGPRSASLIAPLILSMTAQAKSVPPLSPQPPFASEAAAGLARAVYRSLHGEAGLSSAAKAWTEEIATARMMFAGAESRLGMVAWSVSLGRTHAVGRAVRLAMDAVAWLQNVPARDAHRAMNDALERVRLLSAEIAAATVAADYHDRPDVYDASFARALGLVQQQPDAGGAAAVATPRTSAAPPLRLAPATTASASPVSAVVALPDVPAASVVLPVMEAPASAEPYAQLVPVLRAATHGLVARLAVAQTHRTAFSPEPTTGQENVMPLEPEEELQSMVIGEHGDLQKTYDLPEPPAEFARLATGAIPGLTKTPQTAAELLSTFLLARSMRDASTREAAVKPRWVPAGEVIQIQGITLSRGMVYCGRSVTYGGERGIIDPGLPVQSTDDASVASLAGFPGTYWHITQEQRLSFLHWLADGASDPAQASFGLMYFYGLERRLLAEGVLAADTSGDRSEVLAEVERLEMLFRESRLMVSYHALRLLDFLQACALPSDSPNEHKTSHERMRLLPSLEQFYEPSSTLRVGVGSFMRDARPIPAEWMLMWAHQERTVHLRSAAVRNRTELRTAFAEVYRRLYGDGLILKPNKTRLTISYTPANYEMRGPATERQFDDLPDCTKLTKPPEILKDLIDRSTAEIEPYDLFCRRNPGKEQTLGAALCLPAYLWTAKAHEQMDALRMASAGPLRTMALSEVLAALGDPEAATYFRLAELARGLEANGVGMEPDFPPGPRRTDAADCIALFLMTQPQPGDRSTPVYRKASLTVSLAACVTAADGQVNAAEQSAVERLIDSWREAIPDLSVDLRTRLCAQYRVQLSHVPKLSSLRMKLLALTQEERLDMALTVAGLAVSSGLVAPRTVKLLEDLYRLMGLDRRALYANLYGGLDPLRQRPDAGGTEAHGAAGEHAFVLDLGRVAQLQRESEQASALLSSVFLDDEGTATPSVMSAGDAGLPLPEPQPTSTSLAGLDTKHAALLTQLLTRPEWTRHDLAVVAMALQLMLDGALERINDAAFEQLGAAIIEGDDPIFVQADLFEKA